MAEYMTWTRPARPGRTSRRAAGAAVHGDRLRAAVDGVDLDGASRLRAWVNREHDERPTRAELRADVETVLDGRLRLHEQLADANARAEKYRTERDEWHALARERAERIVKLCESRDSARTLRDEYHEAYHQAEAERNTLAREHAALRSELAVAKESAAPRGDALILQLTVPGSGAK